MTQLRRQMERFGYIREIRRSTEEIRFQWRIGNFLSLRHRMTSPGIFWHNASWHVGLWYDSERLGLDFYRYDATTLTLNISVGLRGPRGVQHQTEKKGEMPGNKWWPVWDGDSSLELADVRRTLLQDGTLVVVCKMNVPARDPCPQISLEATKELVDSSEKRAADELQGSLQSLYRIGEGCDVVLEVQGKEFPAHRLILQTRSPVFRAMFTHEMLEKRQNSVTIEDCDSESFPAFLEHLYTGGVRMISGGNVFALYYAADKYGLEALKGACVEFLKRNLSVASFCGTVALSIKHGETELTELATVFFCEYTLDILETPEWQIFLAENPTVGNGLYIKLLKE